MVKTVKQNCSPHLALLWSLAIPGFGHFYIENYPVGLVLIVLEFLINTRANLNLAILYSFRGEFWLANQCTNFQWLLFYPCIYAFASWHAYHQAVHINNENNNRMDSWHSLYNGLFIGVAAGGTLGVIYSFYFGPVICGLIGMGMGAAIGLMVEKRLPL